MKGLIQIVTVAVLMAAVILGPSIMAYAGSNAPEWVVRGSGAGEFRARRVFYGVGKAENIENKSRLFFHRGLQSQGRSGEHPL